MRNKPKLWEASKREANRKMGGHSARSMQLAVKIYKKKGGGYLGKKKKNNSLSKWTRQKWQTRPGTNPVAKRGDGKMARYLPKRKWASLSKSEQLATDKKKLLSKYKYVKNTKKASM